MNSPQTVKRRGIAVKDQWDKTVQYINYNIFSRMEKIAALNEGANQYNMQENLQLLLSAEIALLWMCTATV